MDDFEVEEMVDEAGGLGTISTREHRSSLRVWHDPLSLPNNDGGKEVSE